MTRTYWLSFCDSDKPKGEQFLGACVVDVTEGQAAEAFALKPEMHDKEEGPWIGGAIRQAWLAGVNPGGQVLSARIDEAPQAALYPRLVLMSRADIEALEPSEVIES